jgi:type II secretory pathway predicted ATPase ExeA
MSMYLTHFGLTEAPFKITPHTEFFFSGANRGETLEALIFAVMSGEGMVKVTGEVGSGKTMLCRVLMERLPAEVETIYLAVPSISRDEILATIAGDLGIDTTGQSTTKLIRALQQRLIDLHAAGKQVVALIDEAHAMPLETLEEIRLLSNLETNRDKLMQIVLFGQPELDAHLALPNMRQLRERITHSFGLQPLPARDIKDYLNFRLRQANYKGPDLFHDDAVKVIAEASEGLTRRINIFADKTLLAAYAEGTHNVTAKQARAAVADTQIILQTPVAPMRKMAMLFALLAGLAIGGAGGFFLARHLSPPVSPTVLPSRDVAPMPPPTAVSSAATDATATVAPPAPAATVASAQPPPPVGAATPDTEDVLRAKTTSPSTAAGPNSPEVTERKGNTASGDWLESRLQVDANRLRQAPADSYTIQLMTADGRESTPIRDYLRAAAQELEQDRLMVFPSGAPDNPKVTVVYAGFSARNTAQEELNRLSPKLRQFRPWVRPIAVVREEIRPPG